MSDSLEQTAGRLAAGSQGRTEADIQSDVRKFLLDASLELGDEEIIDVALETQAGGGRRIDVEAGCVAIEVKKSLAVASVFEAAVEQLAGYVAQRTAERGQRYVGILSDGRTWVLFHLAPGGGLAEVTRLELRGGDDAERLASWLETVLATNDTVVPTPAEITKRLGAASPSAQLDIADLRALYESCRTEPEVQLKRELWARLLLSALGTNFENSDELFVTHTYLVLIAELLAHEVMGIPIDAPGDEVRALLDGQKFDLAGIHGVVEADFFDWPAVVGDGHPIIKSIARRLSRFDWAQVEHDVLKTLYESIIDAETRHKLGEYYTPDWLAEMMIDKAFTNPLEQRLLDPACGSGTFLFWAVRRVLAACDSVGMSNRDAVDRAVSNVQGIDLHPVAVTLARVTYLLALTPARLADRGELTVPVFLGDSVRWEQDDTLLTKAGITIHTSDGLELFAQELHFPEGVLEDPVRFDRLATALADKAASRKTSAVPRIGGLLDANRVLDETDRVAVELVFAKLCRLHDAGRDHVWSYYIRNLARPLSFTRPEGRVDVLVGNPPWLAYRSMPAKIQQAYRAMATQRGLWAGGNVATNQDLSDLFVARSVEQYLKLDGTFSFVMPYATLSRRQYAGFRTASWASPGGQGTTVAFTTPDSFVEVRPPMFPVPSCVVVGRKASKATALPREHKAWRGTVAGHNQAWADVASSLTVDDADTSTAEDVAWSVYASRFAQGATMVPSKLVRVEAAPAGPLGMAAGRTAIRSATSTLAKKPWKDLADLEGVVETQFLHPMHVGASVAPFRELKPELALVPWADGDLLDAASERLDEFPGLADWWRRAERMWEQHRSRASTLSLRGRLDFQRGLRRQFPIARYRVVYTASGSLLAACLITDATAIIEHKLYWAAVESPQEGRYLCAILNSTALADAVAPLQSVGQFGRRDFDKYVFALNFPKYDQDEQRHVELAALTERAEAIAAAVALDPAWGFQKARRIIRVALAEDGVAADVDRAVGDLLGTIASTDTGAGA